MVGSSRLLGLLLGVQKGKAFSHHLELTSLCFQFYSSSQTRQGFQKINCHHVVYLPQNQTKYLSEVKIFK